MRNRIDLEPKPTQNCIQCGRGFRKRKFKLYCDRRCESAYKKDMQQLADDFDNDGICNLIITDGVISIKR